MNRCELIGRIVKDGELRFTPSGSAVWNATLAIDRPLSKEKKAELQAKNQPTADFIRIIAWGQQAENAAKYTSKGSLIAVEGSIQTGTYKTNTGETRYSTDVKADKVQFLSRPENAPKDQSGDDFNFGGYDPGDFQAMPDGEDVPW